MTTKEALERLKQPFNTPPDTDSYFDAKEVAMKSLKKDLSIVKELEKVREKIATTANEGLWSEGIFIGLKKAICIIDEHISELKGEQE